jgi:glycosyltransferase 2 family protein
MTVWFKTFIAASLIGLAVTLYQADYLRVPAIVSTHDIAISIGLLFASFVAAAASWWRMLRASGIDAEFTDCLAGQGLSLWGKYLPGKIWLVVGRAAYASQKSRDPLSVTGVISLSTQLIDIWAGLTLGALGLCAIRGWDRWGLAACIAWALLTLLVFSPITPYIAEALGSCIGKKIEIPRVRLKETAFALPWFLASWGLTAVAFYFLVRGLVHGPVSLSVGLGMPLAQALGITAIFLPGGIGVREGVLISYLVVVGMTLPDSTTVAITARLWFLLGEVLFFAVALMSDVGQHETT